MPLHTEDDTVPSIADPVHTEEEHNADKPNQESDVESAGEQATIPAIEAHLDHSDVASVASTSSHVPSLRKADTASRSGSSCQSRNIARSATGESDPSCTAEFDVVRFRNNYLQAVEELRMRRTLDMANEEKIKRLIAEKHQLQQKYDDVEHNYHKTLEQCSNQEQEIRRRFSNQMKLMEEEKSRQSCSDESREMEIKALKDEIRALHLAKYNVEKKVEEQERQLQLQSSSRESFMAEVSQLEQKCHTAVRQGSEIVEQMAHLETNVKQAVELNRKLQYVNEHQKCILEGYKRELESCRQELVDTRVSLADRQAEMLEGEGQTGRKTRATEQDLKMHTELTKQLQLQLTGLREEHQAALHQLKEAHSLIDKHVECNSRLQSSEGVLKGEVANLQECKEKLQTDLTALQQRIASQTDEWLTEKQQLITKSAEVECRLRSLQEDYTALQESHDRLEADSKARVAELQSQLTEMAVREKRWEERVVQERESLVEEWAGKVRLLERSLEHSKAYLQERKRSIQDKEVQVPDETVQHPTHSPRSTALNLEDSSDGSRSAGGDNNVESTKYVPKLESPLTKESQRTVSVSPLPIPPRGIVLSPEVISPSNSPNLEQEHSMNVTAKLPSPRVHLERIQLPFNRSMHNAHNEEDCGEERSNGRPVIPEQQLESNLTPQEISHSEQETVHSTPDIPAPLKRKVENHQTAAGDGLTVCDTPSKKQKVSNPCYENLGTSKNTMELVSSPLHQDPVAGQSSLSQPTHTSGTDSFLPLSQPCHSNVVTAASQGHVGAQKRRGSSLRSVPWRLEIPKPPAHVTRPLTTEEKEAASLSRADRNDLSKAGSITFQMPFMPQSLSSSPRQHTTQNLSCPEKSSSPLIASDNKLQLEVNPSSSMQPASSKTTNTVNENAHCLLQGTQQPKEGQLPAAADQSDPDIATVDNFAVVFSEGEDEGEGGDCLISSQMHRQIDKVHTFLKMDRLRRTKVSNMNSSSK